jgi:hypothetical protein
MPVRDKNGIHDKAASRTHHLLLGTFTAVKKKGIRPAADHETGRVAQGSRERPCSAEEINLKCLAAH